MGFFFKRMGEEVKPLLDEGEKVVMMLSQSLISDIAPSFIMATSKRLIIINNSFWGLYARRNILTPSDYNNIFYKEITSVVLVKGKIFSSINVRLLGGFEKGVSEQRLRQGEIDGLRTPEAIILYKHLDKMVQEKRENEVIKSESAEPNIAIRAIDEPSKNHELHLKLYYAYKGALKNTSTKMTEIGFDDAIALVNEGKAKFVWLGTEPAEYISRILTVPEGKVVQLDPDEIGSIDKSILATMSGDILVCYNGNLSRFIAEYMDREYNIPSYSLKGGILKVVSMSMAVG